MTDHYLFVEQGEEDKRTIPVSKTPVVLGKPGPAEVAFKSDYVSRRHAEIDEVDGTLAIRDLGSRNGTYVNGKRIDEPWRSLKPGDTIWLAKRAVVLRYQTEPTTLRQYTLQVDSGARNVYVDGVPLDPPLSKKEFDVLALLASKRGEFFSNDAIAQSGWPEREDGAVSDEEIRQVVKRIRDRIQRKSSKENLIENRRGSGYRLV